MLKQIRLGNDLRVRVEPPEMSELGPNARRRDFDAEFQFPRL